jgi:hypothetical protein
VAKVAKHGANGMKIVCVLQIFLGYWIPQCFGLPAPDPWALAQLALYQYMFVAPVDVSIMVTNIVGAIRGNLGKPT